MQDTTEEPGTAGRPSINKIGDYDILVPRDRNLEFEPRFIGKRQTWTDDLENRIGSMQLKGISTRDISYRYQPIE